MRFCVNFDEDLVKKMDRKAKKLHLSRSAYMSVSMARVMQNEELFDCMPDLLKFTKKIEKIDFEKLNFSDKKQ